jgi:glycosyltransferase involved in cell wall biosynthesis
MMSKVSVLIPTYNRANYIEECLDSILNQTVPPFEIIVIDDGSEDDTAERLKQYKDRIIYLHKENGGKPSALNWALKHARGDYIWLFDDDDVALPDAIEKRQLYLDQHPDIDFVFTSHYWGKDGIDGKIERGGLYILPQALKSFILPELLKGCCFTLQSVMAKSKVYHEIGPFDEQLVTSEDYDMMIRMAYQYTGVGIDTPSFIFRQHEGIRGPKQLRYAGKDRKNTFRRYDQILGRKLHSYLPIYAYGYPQDNYPPILRPVIDHLSRMVVMASKGLTSEMLDDLATAIKLYKETPPGSGLAFPRHYCSQAVYTGYATAAILQDWTVFISRLKAMPLNKASRSAIFGFAKGFYIKAKSYPGTLLERLDYLNRAISCLLLLLR